MRRALAAAMAAWVLVAPTASAHVLPRPDGIPTGETRQVTLEAPSEREDAATTGLVVVAPEGLTIEGAADADGWSVTYDSRRATWSGGRIAEGDTADFTLELTATGRPGTVELQIRQQYDDGPPAVWPTRFAILPADATAPKQRLGRALVASLIGVAVVAGSLVVLRRSRRDDAA